MKSTESSFTSGKIAHKVGTDGGGDFTEDILRGGIDPNILLDMDASTNMSSFMEELQGPISKIIGQLIKELQYNMDKETYTKFSLRLESLPLHHHQEYITDII